MAETNTLITEEDIQKQRELVSKLEANMQSLQTRLPESSARIESLTKQIASNESEAQQPVVQASSDDFEEMIPMIPAEYSELEKQYQTIADDADIKVLEKEVRKLELDTAYGPNPEYDTKLAELNQKKAAREQALNDLKNRMNAIKPVEVSQLDFIINRLNDGIAHPYDDFMADKEFIDNLAVLFSKELPNEMIEPQGISTTEIDDLNTKRNELIKQSRDMIQNSPEYLALVNKRDTYQSRLNNANDKFNALQEFVAKSSAMEKEAEVSNTTLTSMLSDRINKLKAQQTSLESLLQHISPDSPDFSKTQREIDDIKNTLHTQALFAEFAKLSPDELESRRMKLIDDRRKFGRKVDDFNRDIGRFVPNTDEYREIQSQIHSIDEQLKKAHSTKKASSYSALIQQRNQLNKEIATNKSKLEKATKDEDYSEIQRISGLLKDQNNNLTTINDQLSKFEVKFKDPIQRYHELRERVERAKADSDDMYPEFEKDLAALRKIERAAYLHINHRDKEIGVTPTPEPPAPLAATSSSDVDLEDQLNKAKEEHNKLIGDVNKTRADYNEAKNKLDELIAKKKEQDKKAEPPVNPFDNSGTATIKATRWECKFQGYAKKGLVKIATSTAFGKRIYDNLRAKRAEKYAKKLNRLQEVYDVANANYNRIEGNYNRIANEISNMQNLIDQKLEFEKLQQKVNNEKKSVQIIMQRRVALFKKSLDLLNIPDDQKRKISETEVRQMLETKSDQMSKEMLGQLKKYADLMKKANNAMKKDAEELANVKNQYHQRLKQCGYDSATDSKNLEIQIMTRLDKAKEEQQNFDYSQLETLSNDRALAEKKLNQFKNYVQRNGATITPVEVELNPDELTERKVKSSAPKQNRFSVWFDGLKQRFSRNKDEELAEYAFENAGEVDEEKEKLASFAFANAGELDSNPKENSSESITSNNTATQPPKEPSEEQDFSVPIQPIEKSQNAPVGLPVKPSVVSTQAPQHPEQIRVVRPSKKTSEESTIASNLQKAILGTEESRLQARADKFEKDSAKTVMPTQDSKDVTKQESTPKEDYSAYEDQTVHQLSEIGIDYNSLSDAAKKAAREHFVKHFASDDSAKTDESTRHM